MSFPFGAVKKAEGEGDWGREKGWADFTGNVTRRENIWDSWTKTKAAQLGSNLATRWPLGR